MKTLRFIIIFILLVVATAISVDAQQTQFSQFYSSPTLLSPSYAGMTDGTRAVLNYRDQWPNVPGTFVTYAVALDHWLYRMNSGIGIVMFNDKAGDGDLSLTQFGVQYSYDIAINRFWHVRPGIYAKYAKRSLNYNALIFGDQIDSNGDVNEEGSIEVLNLDKTQYIDLASSVLVYSEKYWAGLTADHLLRPNQSFTLEDARLQYKFSVFGGTRIPIKQRRSRRIQESVTLSFLYKNQIDYDQLDLGAYYTNDPFTAGLWFRGLPVMSRETKYENIDAIIVLVGYRMGDLSFGYSYDFTISRLMSSTGGSHELSLIYEFNKNVKVRRKRRNVEIPCPQF